jgi:hypothetical protein
MPWMKRLQTSGSCIQVNGPLSRSINRGCCHHPHSWGYQRGTLRRPAPSVYIAADDIAAESEICVVGIDLGTTNSAVAVRLYACRPCHTVRNRRGDQGFPVLQIVEGGQPVIVPTEDGKNVTPSVVSFQKDGTVLVGELAKRCCGSRPCLLSIHQKPSIHMHPLRLQTASCMQTSPSLPLMHPQAAMHVLTVQASCGEPLLDLPLCQALHRTGI